MAMNSAFTARFRTSPFTRGQGRSSQRSGRRNQQGITQAEDKAVIQAE
jgi:hypothetical protein